MPDITRRPDGTFAPGSTGNKGGRPSIPGDVREALELGSLAAAQRLVGLVADPDPRIALAASVALLDRTLGRPAQALEVAGREPDWGLFLPAFQSAVLESLRARHEDGDE
jgi:hypothetical protein